MAARRRSKGKVSASEEFELQFFRWKQILLLSAEILCMKFFLDVIFNVKHGCVPLSIDIRLGFNKYSKSMIILPESYCFYPVCQELLLENVESSKSCEIFSGILICSGKSTSWDMICHLTCRLKPPIRKKMRKISEEIDNF